MIGPSVVALVIPVPGAAALAVASNRRSLFGLYMDPVNPTSFQDLCVQRHKAGLGMLLGFRSLRRGAKSSGFTGLGLGLRVV